MSDPPRTYAIGIDVGGTKIVGGLVDAHGRISARRREPTPVQDPAQLCDAVVTMVTTLAAGHSVSAVGVGVAGWVGADRVTVRSAPHLPWRDAPVGAQVAEAVGLPVTVENDANAAAWGEYRFGGTADEQSLVLVTVGTGIGAGIVTGGALVHGGFGHAAEPGHQRVVPDGRRCRCGRRGCLEQYASGQALVRAARDAARDRPDQSPRLREADDAPDGVTGPVVTAAARDGDPVACAAFDEVGEWLGSGLADLVYLLDPAVLVVGGGVAEAGELLLAPTRQAYQRELADRGRLPVAAVRPARCGNDAGLAGVADLAREAVS